MDENILQIGFHPIDGKQRHSQGAQSFDETVELLRVCDEPEDVVKAVLTWYTKQELTGKKALH